MKGRGLGYIVDAEDPRDQPLARLGLSPARSASFSLADEVLEVLDQGDTSKCVAHSFAQALRIADRVSGVRAPQLSSRDFLYYNALGYDGRGFVDAGTQLRSCARGLAKFGRPPESIWPFKHDALVERPSWGAYREGYDYAGPRAYLRVNGLEEIRQALAASKPVVGGTQVVGQSLLDYTGGIYDAPDGEPSKGGHAMTIVGYDPQCFTIVNSWGRTWGEDGFIRVTPRFLETFDDLWAIHL